MDVPSLRGVYQSGWNIRLKNIQDVFMVLVGGKIINSATKSFRPKTLLHACTLQWEIV